MPMTRRHFLQQGAAAAVALTTTPSLLAIRWASPSAARPILSAPRSIRILPGR